jgi:hypothetical protein
MSSVLPTLDETVVSAADVTIALEPGVEQTFHNARVEVMPPKPGRGDKAAVMVLIWVDPAELHLWPAITEPPVRGHEVPLW